MSLLNNLPGLGRHSTPTAVKTPPPFDYALVERRVREAWLWIDQRYPSGALPWIRQYRPEVAAFLREQDLLLDAECQRENMSSFVNVLDVWQKAYLRAFAVYQDAQNDLQGSLL